MSEECDTRVGEEVGPTRLVGGGGVCRLADAVSGCGCAALVAEPGRTESQEVGFFSVFWLCANNRHENCINQPYKARSGHTAATNHCKVTVWGGESPATCGIFTVEP